MGGRARKSKGKRVQAYQRILSKQDSEAQHALAVSLFQTRTAISERKTLLEQGEDLAEVRLRDSPQMYSTLDTILYVHDALEASIFTWSEELVQSFAVYVNSPQFKQSVLNRKWVHEINLLEKVARDEVIRGYFSDEDVTTHDQLRFSVLKGDLASLSQYQDSSKTTSDDTSTSFMTPNKSRRRHRPRPHSVEIEVENATQTDCDGDSPSQEENPTPLTSVTFKRQESSPVDQSGFQQERAADMVLTFDQGLQSVEQSQEVKRGSQVDQSLKLAVDKTVLVIDSSTQLRNAPSHLSALSGGGLENKDSCLPQTSFDSPQNLRKQVLALGQIEQERKIGDSPDEQMLMASECTGSETEMAFGIGSSPSSHGADQTLALAPTSREQQMRTALTSVEPHGTRLLSICNNETRPMTNSIPPRLGKASPRSKALLCPKKVRHIRERMQQKREQLLFNRKVVLIEKHLCDPEHPLMWLLVAFARELRDYYDLFIDVNRQCEAQANAAAESNTSKDVVSQSGRSNHFHHIMDESIDNSGPHQQILDTSVGNAFNTSALHAQFIKQSVITSHIGNETSNEEGGTLKSRQAETPQLANSGKRTRELSPGHAWQQNVGGSAYSKSRRSQSHFSQLTAANGQKPFVYSPKQISDFITESVKEFISLFKTALFKFYRIRSYMRSQEDEFIALVTRKVLNKDISAVLVEAARALHADESKLFRQAVRQMAKRDIGFWVGPGESQFWLDAERYDAYVALKRELQQLEARAKTYNDKSSEVDGEVDQEFQASSRQAGTSLGPTQPSNLIRRSRTKSLEPQTQLLDRSHKAQQKAQLAEQIASVQTRIDNLKKGGAQEGQKAYASTISVLKSLQHIKSLSRFKEALKYAWNKIQTEIYRFWIGKNIEDRKLILGEDPRLMVVAYVLTQAGASGACRDFIPMLYMVQAFANDQLYEECAPLATFESSSKVIAYEFEENVINHQTFVDCIEPRKQNSSRRLDGNDKSASSASGLSPTPRQALLNSAQFASGVFPGAPVAQVQRRLFQSSAGEDPAEGRQGAEADEAVFSMRMTRRTHLPTYAYRHRDSQFSRRRPVSPPQAATSYRQLSNPDSIKPQNVSQQELLLSRLLITPLSPRGDQVAGGSNTSQMTLTDTTVVQPSANELGVSKRHSRSQIDRVTGMPDNRSKFYSPTRVVEENEIERNNSVVTLSNPMVEEYEGDAPSATFGNSADGMGDDDMYLQADQNFRQTISQIHRAEMETLKLNREYHRRTQLDSKALVFVEDAAAATLSRQRTTLPFLQDDGCKSTSRGHQPPRRQSAVHSSSFLSLKARAQRQKTIKDAQRAGTVVPSCEGASNQRPLWAKDKGSQSILAQVQSDYFKPALSREDQAVSRSKQ